MTALYAFWSIDDFPFFAGSPVYDMNDKGHVLVGAKDHDGAWVRPALLVPDASGRAIQQELIATAADYERALEDLNTAFVAGFRDRFHGTLGPLLDEERLRER